MNIRDWSEGRQNGEERGGIGSESSGEGRAEWRGDMVTGEWADGGRLGRGEGKRRGKNQRRGDWSAWCWRGPRQKRGLER